MMDFISVPLIVGIVFLGVYKLFELFVCRSERLKIIERLSNQLDPTDVVGKLSLPNHRQPQFSFGALKGGCLMLGIGAGLLLGFSICAAIFPGYLTGNGWEYNQISGIVYGSCILFFGGLALLIAFLIEIIIGKKKE